MLDQVGMLEHEVFEIDLPEYPDLSDEALRQRRQEHIDYCREEIERQKGRLEEEMESKAKCREWQLSLYRSMTNPPEEIKKILTDWKGETDGE
jgi:hypothetical protein